ncbi:MAG: hypothetical protein DCF19_02890 [Pseudanabaena frigida]|uniref:Peptidase M16 n=1 Tax=Pseudanabaena frigida TaxID=945775 RepID=A0A2W4YBH0_9CYAN|nr:MAG: hypothetical protein DCF19_02890 [Pseudanabaena frigida]
MYRFRQLFLFLLLLFTATPALALETKSSALSSLQRYQLPNGLRVWHLPRLDSKSVIVMLAVNTGSRYETTANNGISHYLEHMLFDGTERWNEEQIKDVISTRGGIWNGWTTKELTGYYAQVGDRDADIALDWLSQIVFHSILPADKIDKERHVVFQEKGGQYGWLVNKLEAWGYGYDLSRKVSQQLFPNSTLTMSVIGEEDSLNQINREMLLAYYKQYYTPRNAVLIVVGNITPQQLRTLVKKHFGNLPAGNKSPDFVTPTSPNAGPYQVKVGGPMLNDQISLMTGVQTVGKKHRDRWALQVLSEFMDRDLSQEIRTKRGLVYSIGAYNSSFKDVGYFAISTRSEEKHRDAILQYIDTYIEQLRQGKIDAKRLAEAKTALIGRWSISMEDNMTRASWLLDWSTILSDNEVVPDYDAEINKVTAADLVRVIQSYFVPQRRFVGIHQPVITVFSGLLIGGVVLLLIIGGAIGYKLWRRSKVKAIAKVKSAEV